MIVQSWIPARSKCAAVKAYLLLATTDFGHVTILIPPYDALTNRCFENNNEIGAITFL